MPRMDAQYKGCCFKYAELGRWCVVVTSPAAINELAKAPEDVLSSVAGNDVVSDTACSWRCLDTTRTIADTTSIGARCFPDSLP